jgi:hypothetical protein
MKRRQERKVELDALTTTPIRTLWERDLDRLLEAYEVSLRFPKPNYAFARTPV